MVPARVGGASFMWGKAGEARHHYITAFDMGRDIRVGQGREMMDDEEVNRPKRVERLALDPLSVADLQAYIAELRGEITRVEAAIETKQGARGHADSFFRKP